MDNKPAMIFILVVLIPVIVTAIMLVIAYNSEKLNSGLMAVTVDFIQSNYFLNFL